MITLYTIPQTAEVLGCCENHVYDLIAAGELPVTDIAGPTSRRTKSRIAVHAVDAYIKKHTRTVAKEAK